MRAEDGPLLLVGGGKMGGALAQGWLAAGLPAELLAIVEPDPARRSELERQGLVNIIADLRGADPGQVPGRELRAVILAVKPQMMDEVAPLCRPRLSRGTLVLSIAAGKPIASFERHFGAGAPIVRAMPNTPAAVGRGASVLCANAAAGAADRALAQALMAAVGETYWVEDEELMHAVTALSGSGPAYVFLLVEALAAAGAGLGLPEALATRLARATVSGSGELVRQSAETAQTLRRNVTSPGGTTQAALDVLMATEGLEPLLRRALEAAAQRSRELA
jgi:pyrroline-5-carboxylate reductase